MPSSRSKRKSSRRPSTRSPTKKQSLAKPMKNTLFEKEESRQRLTSTTSTSITSVEPYFVGGTAGGPRTVIRIAPDNSSAEYDTELEVEVENVFVPYTSRSAYIDECRVLSIRPVPAILRTIDTDALVARHNHLGPKDARAISVALFDNMTVRTVDLEDNVIGPEGTKHLAEVLNVNVYITDVNLAENQMGSFGLRTIAEVVASSDTVRKLNLSGNGFKDDDANYIVKMLTENYSMVELDISYNGFGHCASPILGQAISSNDTLRVLNIGRNHLGKLHVDKLLAAFMERNYIRVVDMSWNGLGDPGAKEIGVYLAKNPEVTTLDISNNNFSAEGAMSIAKGLKENTGLVTLRMGQNPIRPAGALAILMSVADNERSALRTIDMKATWVDLQFHDIYNKLRKRRKIDISVAGILEDFHPRADEMAEVMRIKQEAAKEIEEQLKSALKTDPLMSLVYHMDRNDMSTDDFAKELPVERRSRSVHLAPFRKLLEASETPLNHQQAIIRKFKFKEDKFYIDKFRKELVNAVNTMRDLIDSIGEFPRELQEELEQKSCIVPTDDTTSNVTRDSSVSSKPPTLTGRKPT